MGNREIGITGSDNMKVVTQKLMKLHEEFGEIFGGKKLYDFKSGFLYMSACLLKLIDSNGDKDKEKSWDDEVLSRFNEILYEVDVQFEEDNHESRIIPQNFEDVGIDISEYRAEKDLQSFARDQVSNFESTDPSTVCFALLHIFRKNYFNLKSSGTNLTDNDITDGFELFNVGVLGLVSELIRDRSRVYEHGSTIGLIASCLNDGQLFTPVGYENFVWEDGTSPTEKDRIETWNRKSARILFSMLSLSGAFSSSIEQGANLNSISDCAKLVEAASGNGVAHLDFTNVMGISLGNRENATALVDVAWKRWSEIAVLLGQDDTAVVVASEDYFTCPNAQQFAKTIITNEQLASVIKLPIAVRRPVWDVRQLRDTLYLMVLTAPQQSKITRFYDLDESFKEGKNVLSISKVVKLLEGNNDDKHSWNVDLIQASQKAGIIENGSLAFNNLSVENLLIDEFDEKSEVRRLIFLTGSENDDNNRRYSHGFGGFGDLRFFRLNNDPLNFYFDGNAPTKENQVVLAITSVDKNSFWPTILPLDVFIENFDNRDVAAYDMFEKEVYPPYIVYYLHSEKPKNFLRRLHSCTGIWEKILGESEIHNTRMRLLDLVPIELPDLDTQKRIVEDALRKSVEEKNAQIAEEREEANLREMELLGMIRHQHSPLVGNLSDNWGMLLKYLNSKEQSGTPFRFNEKIDERLQSTVGDYAERVNANLDELQNLFATYERVMGVSQRPLQMEKINLLDLLRERINSMTGLSDSLRIYFEGHEDLEIESDKEVLWQVIYNFIINSNAHGFGDKYDDLTVGIIAFQVNDKLILRLIDNGVGFPDGFSEDDYLMSGKRVGLYQGSGLGGYIINRCLRRLSANFFLTSVPNSDAYEVLFGDEDQFEEEKSTEEPRIRMGALDGSRVNIPSVASFKQKEQERIVLNTRTTVPWRVRNDELPTMLRGSMGIKPYEFNPEMHYIDWGKAGLCLTIEIPQKIWEGQHTLYGVDYKQW